ncbi:tetratricopeptide repeat protein [Bathymodiolus azoricus thioautotrophic gill symbiont]|uniref:Serine/threonine protein kinase n=1 Tax=Bathymodiolus azoricus thioautotrophic gill symbiont TaxID=235205 RepID=A0A1H6MUU3_9GAMM|nr:tetratricopeptide repeat protein [Bathymodiolus azoricus thioautotrophic gill symbiont]SEI05858.1 serine/threonine protein kinase [Bathymodiolus azoricus thioautotrophic gill symbiont]
MSDKNVKKMTLDELRAEFNEIDDSDNHTRKIEICTQIIKLDPKNYMYFKNRGDTYIDLGEYQKAVNDYDQVITLNPEDSTIFKNRGFAYINLGEYQKAIKDCNQAIKLDPENSTIFNNRGFAYINLGEYQKAIKDFNQAIKLNPEDAEVFTNRGVAYINLGEYQKAIKDLNQAIKLNPEDAAAFTNRGVAYANLGEYQKAIKDFSQAIKLNPEDAAVAFTNRGLAYRKLGKEKEAIEDFKKAEALDPSAIAGEQIKSIKKNFSRDIKKTQDFQDTLEELKGEHKTDEKKWMWISIIVIIAMIAFFVYGQKIINRLPDTVYVFDITSMPSNMSFYTAYVFFSIITFTIIRQYTNAKALRIEASNRVAMSKMFERVKHENDAYQKEFLPKLADAIAYSTIKEKNNTDGLVEKTINGLEKLRK